MDAESIIQQLLAETDETVDLDLLATPLPDPLAALAVERLKALADQNWYTNVGLSLTYANRIVQIGEARGDVRQVALGVMARGDALKFSGQLEQAWDELERAGSLFLSAGDEVGWARTRIGRLYICADLKRAPQALGEAEQARAIFVRHGEQEKLLRLDLNTAVVYSYNLGDHQRALRLYQAALTTARALGKPGEQHVGILLTNMGLAYNFLGDLRQALVYYEQALDIFVRNHESPGVAVTQLNMAYIAQAQGYYRRALRLLHGAILEFGGQRPMETARAKHDMVECYLALNRYEEARELAEQAVSELRALNASYELALTLVHLATAEAELGHFEAARAALVMAEPLFNTLGAATWVAMTHLRRGQIALRQGDLPQALDEAGTALAEFTEHGEQVQAAWAMLLQARALLAMGDSSAARQAWQIGQTMLHIARRSVVLPMRYSAYLLLGQAAERDGRRAQAVRHYTAAVATVERMQRSLTITLRPGFLASKGDALKALMRLHLQDNMTTWAFNDLERAKSQLWFDYLANRENFRWGTTDPHTRQLVEELEHLRTEHHRLYQIANVPSSRADEPGMKPDQALNDLARCERRMRVVTEQLYLQAEDPGEIRPASVPSPEAIQSAIPDDTILIEYYNDGARLWAFSLDNRSLEVHTLPATVGAVDRLLAQLQFNIACASRSGPRGSITPRLTGFAQQFARQLYAALVEPLVPRLAGRQRLIVVPYGALHFLPFHVLHTGAGYLIEQYEMLVLPAAGFVTHPCPKRAGGALVIANSWEGRLPQTLVEGQMVHRLLGGTLYEEQVTRQALHTPPQKVLHVAAHGEHRIDQPDFSYIQLADGQLYTDDLLQCDLSYELVVLSACETGRAHVAAGDELIGLGRGFLYAGAGALIASLWRIEDDLTSRLMERIYGNLQSGASKAGALCSAQRSVLQEYPLLHPAFWGAFQLVGNADPLSA